MARGLSTTYGVGTTDAITAGLAEHSTFRSYSIWSYRNGAGGGSGGRIFDKRSAGAQVELFFNSNANTTYNFDRAWTTGGSFNIAQPATGIWVHFVITYDTTTAGISPIIYQNGVQIVVTVGTATTGSPVNNTDPYVLGNRTNDSARVWDGMLAEFAVWNRILTPQEVGLIYGGQSPDHFSAALVEYLPLDGSLLSKVRRLPSVATGTKPTPHPERIVGVSKALHRFMAARDPDSPYLPWQKQGAMGALIAQ